MHLEKILVPIDFSRNSTAAVTRAAMLARHFHSEVTLLHVNEFLVLHPLSGPLGFGITSTEVERAENMQREQKRLDEFGRTELEGISVKRVLCSGDPANIIVQCANQSKSSLILMPTHGHGAFRNFLLGSVTAKVLHDAACPVWTGAHLAELPNPPAEIGHVFCAVNFGSQTTKTVRWAADLAAELGAKLTVIHAVLDHPPNLPDRFMFQWHEEAYWGAQERLRALLVDLGIQAETLVVSDADISKALSAAAKEKQAGLMVIGRSCAADLAQRLGSHAYSIICNAPCPVVSI